ncbi:MAG: FAD binding domain-containing protein [Ignavibacteria bacterium]|nr:FAD binding domain-containing protein [Ignavibacteria bacterium]
MNNQITFICNKDVVNTTVHPGLSLLDFLRNNLQLTGTKEGCREGDCGACTVLVGELIGDKVSYQSVNSCLSPIGDAAAKHIVTVEGLNNGSDLSVVQNAFVEEGASQCGFCTPGFIVSLTGYFLTNQKFDFDDAVNSMDGNICRCTGHSSIIRAGRKSAEIISSKISNHLDHISALINSGLIPSYFAEIPAKLKELKQVQIEDSEKVSPSYFISGGTDLYVQKWEDILNKNVTLLSSDGISSNIREEDGRCIIGANATVSDFINSQLISNIFPFIGEQLKLFGSLPIRNRASIGGNIVNASPIADMTSILLALDSTVHLKKNGQQSEIKLKDFYKGYKDLELSDGELVAEVSFDMPTENSYLNFEKVSQRTFLDIASANSSIYIEANNSLIKKCNISAGGVSPIPLFLKNTSEFLSGKEINFLNISEATTIALSEIKPITDARGSAEYKSILLRQLIYAHFIKLFPKSISIKDIA